MQKKRSEKSIDSRLVKRMKDVGGWVLKMETTHVSGLPDRLCLFPGGKVAFVEVKAEGKKPRILQLVMHKKLVDLSMEVYVVSSYNDIDLLIQDYVTEK